MIMRGCTFFILIIAINILISQNSYAYYQEEYYVEHYQTDREIREGIWMDFKEDNPLLYHVLKFFNPPIFNNILINIITVMIAIGSLGAIFAFEGGAKTLMILLSLYCWGRIITFFISIYLIGKGMLPY